jgi:glycosyltransferase involved in cell wall biosynthesis
MKLIIQIPCYNEAETLEVALNDLPEELDGIDEIEYLIVDDGSQDDTVEIAKRWGVHHVVSFSQNKGLARGFMAGLDGCLRNGADIIVNTDADNQYSAYDIQRLIQPILDGKADMVVGARPIDEIDTFSKLKKILQHFGSWAVRKASNTDIPDAPSGFRAMTRDAAMRINVVNDYTYTLETIVQAGQEKIPITSVPIHTNPELRPSRLFHGVWSYVKKSVVIILRSYMMYKPLKCFTYLSIPPILAGLLIGVRFINYLVTQGGNGHVQSLILACTLIVMGFLTFMIGLVSDLIASNRRILADTQYHVRRAEYDAIYNQQKLATSAVRTYHVVENTEDEDEEQEMPMPQVRYQNSRVAKG